jgi:hypothetical protein
MHETSLKILKRLLTSPSAPALRDLHADLRGLAPEEFEALLASLAQKKRTPARRAGSREAKASGRPSGRIRRLLLDEAGLQKEDAARALTSGLSKVGFDADHPISKRQSFEAWLDAMMKDIPPGEVLAAAVAIASEQR